MLDPEDVPFSGANIIFDIAVDADENVFLAYFGNRRVLKVDPDGNVSDLLRSEANWAPHGIDVFDGAVYVLESTIGPPSKWQFWRDSPIAPRIRRLNADGQIEILYQHLPE